ncbi:MAG: NADH-quinone oxidoreductase subunit M [Actinomycetota bacterium]|nr:NADH-quinone oxidoreductase subunit M [Actinomycetota bacterium]
MSWNELALTVALAIPLLGAGGIALLPGRADRAIRLAAVIVTGLAFAVVVVITATFDFSRAGELQFEVNTAWIEAIRTRYHLGIDGISLPLFFLTYLLTFLSAIYTLRHLPEPGRPKGFLALMLLLQTGMAGTFVAFDLILFFIFWELVLVPMYFMIGIWGGPRREYASVKFFLYTLFGSVFMLVAFLALFFAAGAVGVTRPWDIVELSARGGLGTSPSFQTIAFLGIFLGFAIKVPMWPFHTWLPDAHTEAPTVGSVLLAGILLKMGTYGFVRIALPILPDGARFFAPIIGVLAVIAIIYGALCCLAQTDVKRLIAFSSVGHMGFVMLGIASLTGRGIQAALYGNIAHGIITGLLFFLAGSLHERYHTREIAEIGGGMLVKMPRYGGLLIFTAIASLGLPGLAGFWGEFAAMWAAIEPAASLAPLHGLYLGLVIVAAVGTVLTAGYFLWMIQRVSLGQPPARWAEVRLADVAAVEWAAWTPLALAILALGVAPVIVFGVQDQAVARLAELIGG